MIRSEDNKCLGSGSSLYSEERTNFVRMFVDFFFVIPNVQVNALFPALEFCFVKTFGKINLWILVVCYFSFSLSSKVPALSMTVIGRHGVETTPILFSSIHNLSGSDDPFCLLFLCSCKLLSSTI